MTTNDIFQRLKAARAETNAQVHGQPADQQAVLKSIDPLLLARVSRPLLLQRLDRYITMHEPTQTMLRAARMAAPYLWTELPGRRVREPVSVLITGESGTGKEIIARIMLGDRAESQFRPINCAGIVDTLFESLLFGHVRGAYTGAVNDYRGALVEAGDGVVFLDEVGDLPLSQQAKLLRALQERCVTPVGSTTTVPLRCRFVFATNRNLPAMVHDGTFREDLYYRINTLQLKTYPLRERPDDAVIIAADFCGRRGYDVPNSPIPPHVINSRGNVRALENWIIAENIMPQ